MLLRRAIAAAAGLIVAASHANAAEDGDALARFDAFVIGAGATEVCNPAFDWSRLQFDAAAIGQGAYDKLLSDLESKAPKHPRNAENADRALKLRTEEMMRQGALSVAEKGCDDPAIRALLKRFEGDS
jgi:hypothetical protein